MFRGAHNSHADSDDDSSWTTPLGSVAILVAIAIFTGTREKNSTTQLPFKQTILEYKSKTTTDLWLTTLAIAIDMKRLCETKIDGVTWSDIESALSQHEIVETREPSQKAISSFIITDETNWFKFNGSPDASKVQNLRTWVEDFIMTNDKDIFEHTQLKDNVLNNIIESVASTGSSVTFWNPLTIIHSKDINRQSVVDVGMIHLPTVDEPYFKLYRIRIDAVRTCSRWFFGESNKGVIDAEMYSRKFYPRTEILNSIKFKSPHDN
jgi:hypothetical protein